MADKSHPITKYEECNLRDDVKLHLPEGFKAKVYKVTSGNSGKVYFVQLEWDKEGNLILSTCQCVAGYFQILIAGTPCCKHVKALLEVL